VAITLRESLVTISTDSALECLAERGGSKKDVCSWLAGWRGWKLEQIFIQLLEECVQFLPQRRETKDKNA
jgi:hypothetical protein